MKVDDMDLTRPKNIPVVKTMSGRYVDPFNFQASDVNLEDIAHALSHQCRYGGAVKTFYSVAEHSIYVARQVLRTTDNPGFALFGLLHDAEEAYLPDMVRPMKQRPEMALYLTAGETIQRVIWDVLIPQLSGGGRDGVMRDIINPIDAQIVPWEMVIFRDSLRVARNPEDAKWEYVQLARSWGTTR